MAKVSKESATGGGDYGPVEDRNEVDGAVGLLQLTNGSQFP